jgi:hypothetical protein
MYNLHSLSCKNRPLYQIQRLNITIVFRFTLGLLLGKMFNFQRPFLTMEGFYLKSIFLPKSHCKVIFLPKASCKVIFLQKSPCKVIFKGHSRTLKVWHVLYWSIGNKGLKKNKTVNTVKRQIKKEGEVRFLFQRRREECCEQVINNKIRSRAKCSYLITKYWTKKELVFL